MGRGLAFSILLHGLLLAWALISFAGTEPLKSPEVRPVEVAVISPDDLVRLRKGVRSSKKLETQPAKSQAKPQKKKAKKVRKVAAAEPPPPPPPPPAAEPEKSPSQDEIAAKLAALEKKRAAEKAQAKAAAAAAEAAREKAAAEAKAKAEAKRKAAAEAKRKAAARKKRLAAKRKRERERRRRLQEKRRRLAEKKRREREAKRKKKYDPADIAALLNKIPDSGAPDSGSQWKPQTKKALPKGPAAGAPEGKDTRLTASQRSLLGVMMKRAVTPCWRVQTGMQGADQLVVELEVRLKPDGSLDGEPKVINRRGGALFADAATNAIRALEQCAPYDLPKDFYRGGWDHMVVTFDPQKMF